MEITLPQEFKERMKTQLGERYEEYEKSLAKPAVRGLRINKKRIDEIKFKNLFNLPLKKLNFSDDGFVLNSEEKIGNLPVHLSGLCYLQEPSSMIPVCASEIEKEKGKTLRVLDLCASPGGKTSQIASRLDENAVIFSNEVISSRVGALYSNVERQGFDNVVILNEKPENLLTFESYFDYVFVDAPCSGEGMFRKNPETINEWSLSNVKMCASRQKQILDIACKLVNRAGKLIYSTCTFSKEEDEEIVDWLIKTKGFELQDVSNEIKKVTVKADLEDSNSDFARKFYPFSGEGEGQFVAVFKSKSEKENRQAYKKYSKSISKLGKSEFSILKDWVNQTFESNFASKLLKLNLVMVGETIYVPPKSLSYDEISLLDNLRFETIGVRLGSLQKGRFEPNHAIFMAFDRYFKNKVEITEPDVIKYMRGEQLDSNAIGKAHVVVTHNGYPLGGAKLVQNKLKNLLPKGLRI